MALNKIKKIKFFIHLLSSVLVSLALFTNIVFSSHYNHSYFFEAASSLNTKEKGLITSSMDAYLQEIAKDNYQTYIDNILLEQKNISFDKDLSKITNIVIVDSALIVSGESYIDNKKQEKRYYEVHLRNLNFETGSYDMELMLSDRPFRKEGFTLGLAGIEAQAAGTSISIGSSLGSAGELFSQSVFSGINKATNSTSSSTVIEIKKKNSVILKGLKLGVSIVGPVYISSVFASLGNPLVIGGVTVAALVGVSLIATSYVAYQYYKSLKSAKAVVSLYSNLKNSCELELKNIRENNGLLENPYKAQGILGIVLYQGAKQDIDIKTNSDQIFDDLKTYALSMGINPKMDGNDLKVIEMIKDETLLNTNSNGDIDPQSDRLKFDSIMNGKVENVNFFKNEIFLKKLAKGAKTIWHGVKGIFGQEKNKSILQAYTNINDRESLIAKANINSKWDKAYNDYLEYKKCRNTLEWAFSKKDEIQKNHINIREQAQRQKQKDKEVIFESGVSSF